MQPIRIGYNKLLGGAVLLFAAAGAAFQLGAGGPTWLLGLSAAGALVGLLYLFRPFLVVTDSAIRAKSLLGYDVRSFRHGGLGELEVVGWTIVLGQGEHRQRLRLPRALLSRRDLEKLSAMCEAARAEREGVLADQHPDA